MLMNGSRMLKRFSAIFVGVAMAVIPATSAFAGFKPEDAQSRALANMDVQQVSFDQTGVPRFLRGSLGQITPETAAADAARLLEGMATTFRATGREAFVARAVQTDKLGQTHVRLSQYYRGLPVFGGDLVVHSQADGSVYAINGSYPSADGVAETPALRSREAMQSAFRSIPDGQMVTKPELQYAVGRDGKMYLVWAADIASESKAGPHLDRVFIDATTGEQVAIAPKILTAKSWKTYTANNGTSLPGSLVLTNNQSTSDQVIQAIHDHTSIVYDYYSGVHGRDSYNGAGATIKSTGHYKSGYVNAYWNGSQMVYGDGDGTNSGPLGDALDVVAHELTHAVTTNTANLAYQNESGALNEAWSDIMGASVEAYSDGAVSANTWKLGEATWTPGTSGDALRYMNDPATDGSSTDYYPDRNYQNCSPNSSNDYCGVHTNSGIANLWYYMLVSGGTHPRGKTSINVSGIGITKARAIAYRALANYMTSNTTFQGARDATTQAANDLYGSTEASAVNAAWDAVGVPGGGGGGGGGGSTLQNGVPLSGLSGSTGAQDNYTMDVPSGSSNLSFAISGGSGDADLYVKFGSAPTTSSYDCRPYKNGNSETCSFASPSTGTWYVMVRAYSTYSGLTLTGSYSGGGNPTPTPVPPTPTPVPSNTAPTANFTSSTADLTASFTNTSSDPDGSISSSSWNFGDGATSSATSPSHTYSAAGTYSVTLTVTDNKGATDTISKSVTVTAPPSGGNCGGTSYAGSLSGSGQNAYEPQDGYTYQGYKYKYYTGGVSGDLEGPGSADFDLYLYKWSGYWKKVDSSTSGSSTESVSSNSSGYYAMKVYSYSGSGGYTLCVQ